MYRSKFIHLIFLLFVVSCINTNRHFDSGNEKVDKLLSPKIFLDSLYFGIGLHGFNLLDSSTRNIPKYFNSLSTANAMKFEAIHPHADEYDWNEADSLVVFAQENNMVVRGHTLLWTNRNPHWLFWDEKGILCTGHYLITD